MEEWKDIKGYEGLYQVSNLGRIKSIERDFMRKNGRIYHAKERILKPFKNHKGYHVVDLYKENKRKTISIHRLVAETFIPNPDNKPTVDHINTILTDNRVENLRWFTYKEQVNDNEITKERRTENSKKMCKKVINLDTNEVFDSIAEAARKYNLHTNGTIIRCCNGELKTAAKCRWAYYNNKEDKGDR